MRLSRTSLGVKKGGTGTYTVVLTSEPTSSVTITVSGATSDVTVDPTTAADLPDG